MEKAAGDISGYGDKGSFDTNISLKVCKEK